MTHIYRRCWGRGVCSHGNGDAAAPPDDEGWRAARRRAVSVAMTTATRQRILMSHSPGAAVGAGHVTKPTAPQRRLLMTHSYGRREGMRGAGFVAIAAKWGRCGAQSWVLHPQTERPRSGPPSPHPDPAGTRG